MSESISGYGVAVVTINALCIVLFLVSLALYKKHLNYRESKDRVTRFGPWAFLAALILALIQYVLLIADIAYAETAYDLYDYQYGAILKVVYSILTVLDLCGNLSVIFALVVIGSFVQDWTDGKRRKTEDVLIRVTAWLLFVLTLLDLAWDIIYAIVYTRPFYYSSSSSYSYSSPSCNSTHVRQATSLAYACLALLYLLWIAYLAITNFSSYRGGKAYRVLTMLALSLLVVIFTLQIADNALYFVPRRTYRYYCYYQSASVAYYHVVEPVVVAAFYAIVLFLYTFISSTGSKLAKHVDEIYPQSYPQQPVAQVPQQGPIEHYAPAAHAPDTQHTSAV